MKRWKPQQKTKKLVMWRHRRSGVVVDTLAGRFVGVTEEEAVTLLRKVYKSLAK